MKTTRISSVIYMQNGELLVLYDLSIVISNTLYWHCNVGKNGKYRKEYMKNLISILSAAKYLLGIMFFSSVLKELFSIRIWAG